MESKMILREFTTETNEDRSNIVRVRARVSDNEDWEEQKQWIEFQVTVDMKINIGGAAHRSVVLLQVGELLQSLADDFAETSKLGI